MKDQSPLLLSPNSFHFTKKMAFFESSNQPLIPTFLCSSSSSSSSKPLCLSNLHSNHHQPPLIPAPSEPGKSILHSPGFYAACTAVGIFCGFSKLTITPWDVVKCNMQIDPAKYKSIFSGFGVVFKEQGVRGLFRGWAPTFLGYSAQGACKFGSYFFFTKYYSDVAGAEYAAKHKTLIHLASGATAEVIAGVVLCPFEAVKVRVQTQPGFARGLADGLPKFIKSEGIRGLYKGIVPLWGRRFLGTPMLFASYGTTIVMVYKHAIPTQNDQCSKPLQLGFIPFLFCAIITNPADNLVTFLNNAKGATIGGAVKKLGLWGLFTRGLPLRILMSVALSAEARLTSDAMRAFIRRGNSSGGVATSAAPANA